MGFGGSKSSPPAPVIPTPPPAALPPTLAVATPALAAAGAVSKKAKAAAGMGFDNTIGTSPQGLTEKVSLAPATLLGQ